MSTQCRQIYVDISTTDQEVLQHIYIKTLRLNVNSLSLKPHDINLSPPNIIMIHAKDLPTSNINSAAAYANQLVRCIEKHNYNPTYPKKSPVVPPDFEAHVTDIYAEYTEYPQFQTAVFLGRLCAAVHVTPSIEYTQYIPGFFRVATRCIPLEYSGRYAYCPRCKDHDRGRPHTDLECTTTMRATQKLCRICKADDHLAKACPKTTRLTPLPADQASVPQMTTFKTLINQTPRQGHSLVEPTPPRATDPTPALRLALPAILLLTRLHTQALRRRPNNFLKLAVTPLTILSINHPEGLDQQLARQIKDINPDIVMIQEPHYKHNGYIQGGPRSKSAIHGFASAVVSHYNAIYIYNNSIDIQSHLITERNIRVQVQRQNPSENLILQSVYAPVHPVQRAAFFEHDGIGLQTLKTHDQSPPVIMMGDFNDCPNAAIDHKHITGTDRNGQHRLWDRQLSGPLQQAGLIDTFRFLHPNKIAYSRPHITRNTVHSLTRIDHCLISHQLSPRIQMCEYKTCTFSDHNFMILKLQSDDRQESPNLRLGRWHIHTCVTLDPDFRNNIRRFTIEILDTHQEPYTMADWVHMKTRLRSVAMKLASRIGPRNKNLKKQIQDIQKEMQDTNWDDPSQQ
jgi:exonuclease III